MKETTLFTRVRNTGLSEEQTVKALAVVGNFAKEKFPILEGNINAYLKKEFRQADPELVERLFHRSS